jgi:hypothetical protein
MPVMSARHLTRGAALTVAALALAAAVSGCKGQLAVATSSASPLAPASGATSAPAGAPATAADPAATSTAPAATPASQAPVAGALSVAVTSPVTLSGTAYVPVTCVTGLAYRAQVSSAVIHGDQVSYTVAIARYRGPGSYPAVVAVTLRQASGMVTTLAGVSRVPAMITSAGGSFSVSATSSEGRTFTGSLTWTCGS